MKHQKTSHFKSHSLIIFSLLVVLLTPIILVSATIWDDKLVVYYSFNESTGSTAVDSNLNLNATGSSIDASNWVNGKIGNAIRLNGVDEFFTLDADRFLIDGINVSLSFWINTTETTLGMIMGTDYTGGYAITLETGKLQLYDAKTKSGAEFYANPGSIFDGNYHHIVMVRDIAGTNSKIYVDGSSKAITQDTIDSTDLVGNAYLGLTANGGAYFLNATMDEFGFWNRSLNSSEIATLYNSGLGVSFGELGGKVITLNSPVDYYNTTISLVNHNCTGVSVLGGVTILNMSLFSNQSGSFIRTNSTTGLSGTTESYNYGLTYPVGTYDWYCEVCFSDGDCLFSTNNRTINIKRIVENSVSYDSSTQSTSNETFSINITYVPSDWISSSATINYNGTSYSSTKTAVGNNLILNNSLVVPNALTSTNYDFYWNISLVNATGTYYFQTATYSQLVQPLQEINVTYNNCLAGWSSAFNFTSLIEENLSLINFASISYNFQYGTLGNGTALVSSGTFTDIPSFNICINTTSTYYLGYGEIQYQVTGYSARRFYIFENTRLTNVTIINNLSSLITASSTAFQITATDTGLNPYENHYITLLRWYPDLNSYRTVDMGKTDNQGQTVVNVKVNEVDYRLGLYTPTGVLVKLLNPIRMVCQTTPCIYSLIVDLDETDLTTFLNIQSNLSWNPTTEIFTYIWNDPSQDTTLMNLTVWKDYADRESEIICSTSGTGFTGILVCDVSGETGQLRAEVYRSASPLILIAQKLISLRDDLIDAVGGQTMVLFIGLILVMTMALMGVVSPPLVIILSVVGVIPLIFLGGLNFALFIVIGAIAGIILHFLRRISG